MGLALWLRLKSLPNYPIIDDELGTLSALKGIVTTGLPRLDENGLLYWRALLPHYLMALPLFFTDATVQAARIVPTLFSVLILPVAYAGGRMLSGRFAAWLLVGFLAFSNYQNYHAAFARFYLPFQFFFFAATLLGGSYFILGRQKHGAWLLAATLATIASHQLSISLLPLLGFAFLCGRRWELLRSWLFLSTIVLVSGFVWGNLFWAPEQVYVNNEVTPLILGGMLNKWAFYEDFGRYMPLAWTLILLGMLPIYFDRSRLWIYLWCGFLGEMVFLSVVAPYNSPRYMSHLFPFGTLLAMASLCWCIGQLYKKFQKGVWGSSRQALLVGCTVTLLALLHLALFENLERRNGFGDPLTSFDQRPAHEFMANWVTPQDVVISMDPGVTEYFLGRPVNYFLRERLDPVTLRFGPFEPTVKGNNHNYYIDSPERLQEVLATTPQRIWLYVNHKRAAATSVQLQRLINKTFYAAFYDEQNENSVLAYQLQP